MRYDWKPVVKSLCKSLVANGVELVGANDLGDYPEDSEIETGDINKIVDWVTGVDESMIYLKTPDTPEGKKKVIYIVLGNGPEEIAADWTMDELIDKATDDHYEKWANRKTPMVER